MKLSIAMCTCNGARFLQEQLDSFCNQARRPDELVVCDDRSTDETVEILEAFAAEAPFPVRVVVNEEQLGVRKNFEEAISRCEGDVIALSDQDDVWMPTKLERFEQEFEDPAVGMVCCNGELVDEELASLGATSWEVLDFTEADRRVVSNGHSLSFFFRRNFVSGCMMAFPARLRETILPIPEEIDPWIHDKWIATVISGIEGARIVPINEPLVKYRQHGTQELGMMWSLGRHAETTRPSARNEVKNAIQRKNPYAEQIRISEVLLGRFRAQSADQNQGEEAVENLEGRLVHLRVRSKISKRPSTRLFEVLRELPSGRYQRYSNGLRSAVKDLLVGSQSLSQKG